MISITDFDLFRRENKKKAIDSNALRTSFSKVKNEMDEHLDSINANTVEINSNYDYIKHLEAKITKMTERLEEVELKIASLTGKGTYRKEDFENIMLNPKEKEIFLLLYSRSGDLIDYREIGKTLGLTEALSRKHISSLINKGIPVVKKYFENNVFLVLDNDFRTLQAKEKVVKLK